MAVDITVVVGAPDDVGAVVVGVAVISTCHTNYNGADIQLVCPTTTVPTSVDVGAVVVGVAMIHGAHQVGVHRGSSVPL